MSVLFVIPYCLNITNGNKVFVNCFFIIFSGFLWLVLVSKNVITEKKLEEVFVERFCMNLQTFIEP